MIKIRLHGTPDEIKRFADYLETLPDVRILQRSEAYPDRGKSVYERVYIDIELKDDKKQ
ncbi:MAG: hypothetical protein K2O41_00520 [Clostridia bacterium]|nr:hypothetical protein [Clostridia bacterium]